MGLESAAVQWTVCLPVCVFICLGGSVDGSRQSSWSGSGLAHT